MPLQMSGFCFQHPAKGMDLRLRPPGSTLGKVPFQHGPLDSDLRIGVLKAVLDLVDGRCLGCLGLPSWTRSLPKGLPFWLCLVMEFMGFGIAFLMVTQAPGPTMWGETPAQQYFRPRPSPEEGGLYG